MCVCVALPSPLTRPRFSGRRSVSTVLSHDCPGRPGLRLQSAGGSAVQVCRACHYHPLLTSFLATSFSPSYVTKLFGSTSTKRVSVSAWCIDAAKFIQIFSVVARYIKVSLVHTVHFFCSVLTSKWTEMRVTASLCRPRRRAAGTVIIAKCVTCTCICPHAHILSNI